MTSALPVAVGPTTDHRSYLGGSDIAAVVGLSPYGDTALDVWARKTGRVSWDGNQRTRAGTHFERPILDFYAMETGRKLTYPGTLITGFTGATPDAIDELGRTTQVKMVGVHMAYRWGAEEAGQDGVPAELLPQVHFEAHHIEHVLGSKATQAVVVGQLGTEQRVYTVELDTDFTAALIEQGERFWRDHVLTDRMPIVQDASMETIRALFRKSGGTMLPMTARAMELARSYAKARAEEKAAKERKEQCGAQLCAIIGENGGLFGQDAKVTWNIQRGNVSWKDCAKALGATDSIAEQYRGESTRVLRVTAEEE